MYREIILVAIAVLAGAGSWKCWEYGAKKLSITIFVIGTILSIVLVDYWHINVEMIVN